MNNNDMVKHRFGGLTYYWPRGKKLPVHVCKAASAEEIRKSLGITDEDVKAVQKLIKRMEKEGRIKLNE